MPSRKHGVRVLELRSQGPTIKSADHKVKVDRNMREAAVASTEFNTSSTEEVTLDDFGGRSDALGG